MTNYIDHLVLEKMEQVETDLINKLRAGYLDVLKWFARLPEGSSTRSFASSGFSSHAVPNEYQMSTRECQINTK
jgi:hypothetical protein